MTRANAMLPFWALPLAAVVLSALLVWQAGDAMRESGALSPEHHLTHYSLGEYRWFTGDLENAVAHFQRAMANKPDMMAAHFSLGQVLRQLGRVEQAVASFERALELDPRHLESHNSLAGLLLKRGEIARACRHYEAALAAHPAHHTTLNNLAWILATTGDETLRDGPRALELADRASRKKDDQDPVTLVTLAAANAAADRFDEALAALERAVALAGQTGNSGLADAVRGHFDAYRNRQALRVSTY